MAAIASRTGRQFQRYNNQGCRQVVSVTKTMNTFHYTTRLTNSAALSLNLIVFLHVQEVSATQVHCHKLMFLNTKV
ncbi:hypothetical protein LguiA_004924 [Lonicera macranthoides]